MSTRFDGVDCQEPKISVITVVLNGELFIEQAIQSVLGQCYSNFEYIVIDGGSTDATLAIIQKYATKITGWISEPDKGIADAMNKGVELATGEWLLFLNADDYLPAPHTFSNVVQYLQSDVDVLGFPVLFGDPCTKLDKKSPRQPSWYLNFKTCLLHQGAFMRRARFLESGGYDTSFQVALDYEFFLRVWYYGWRFDVFDEPVMAVMRNTGISSKTDWGSLSLRLAEEKRAQQRHTRGYLRYVQKIYWWLYPAYRHYRVLSCRRYR